MSDLDETLRRCESDLGTALADKELDAGSRAFSILVLGLQERICATRAALCRQEGKVSDAIDWQRAGVLAADQKRHMILARVADQIADLHEREGKAQQLRGGIKRLKEAAKLRAV